MAQDNFHTFGEYMRPNAGSLTAAMEDYLEMVYRLSRGTGFTRVNNVAEALNVQPPSVTRMLNRLAQLNLITYERYGIITLKKAGQELGESLLQRHVTIERFLRLIGVPEEIILAETEKIEHTTSDVTVRCFGSFTRYIETYYPGLPAALRRDRESK